MSKELDDFYKKYSARITEMDDMPLVKVMDGGKFKLLSIEEYEEMTNKLADLEAKLAESEEEIKQLNNRILFSQLQAPEEQKLKIIGSSCCQYNPKRDKISFGVEQLEKVKELVEEKSMTQSPFGTQKIYASDVSGIIDNQIEELKKETK